MKILFVGSERLQVPWVMFSLHRMGHEVEMYSKPGSELEDNEEQGQLLEDYLKKERVDFVLSTGFTRTIAGITNRLEIKYAVWCMDSPAYTTWVQETEYDNCFLFYFDYRECEQKRLSGCSNVYHLPLASDIVWNGQLVVTDEEIKKYGCNMSFVGGLYTHNKYGQMAELLSAKLQDALTDIIERSSFVWDGQDRLQMPPELVQTIRQEHPEIFDYPCNMSDEYFFRTYFMGRKLTQIERTLLMELLSQQYDIHLYTRDTEQVPNGVRRFPVVPGLSEAPKVYYSSKINLNITLRSIASGVPLRVFDVMSVGGFMLSNWQEEIPELFVEDKEIVTYKTPEELIEKADYYLKHEDKRVRIGVNGYRKVKERHTYEHRLEKIISILFPTP